MLENFRSLGGFILAKCCGSFNKFNAYFRPSLDLSLPFRFFTERRNEKSEEGGRERWGEVDGKERGGRRRVKEEVGRVAGCKERGKKRVGVERRRERKRVGRR